MNKGVDIVKARLQRQGGEMEIPVAHGRGSIPIRWEKVAIGLYRDFCGI